MESDWTMKQNNVCFTGKRKKTNKQQVSNCIPTFILKKVKTDSSFSFR